MHTLHVAEENPHLSAHSKLDARLVSRARDVSKALIGAEDRAHRARPAQAVRAWGRELWEIEQLRRRCVRAARERDRQPSASA